jgi:ankyrin repeat protein
MESTSPLDAKLHELFNVILHAPAPAVREYITQPGVNVELQNEKGDTALLLAARRGDIEVVQALLDPPVCANIHTRNLKGSNALIAAAMKGHTEICKLLLKHGADVNQSTDSSDTALSLAIWQNHTDVCLLLMHAGAQVDNVDKFGDCLAYGTRVLRADGTTVEAEKVQVGMELCGLDGQTAIVQAVDALKTTDTLLTVQTSLGSYSVTPRHKLVLRWNVAPRVYIEAGELRITWYSRRTRRMVKKIWRGACPDERIPQPSSCDDDVEFECSPPNAADAHEELCAIEYEANVPSLPSIDITTSLPHLLQRARDWFHSAIAARQIDPLLRGELVEIKAQALYDDSEHLLLVKEGRSSQQKVSGRRVQLPTTNTTALSVVSNAFDERIEILAIQRVEPDAPVNVVDIQVIGGLYALEHGILTHNSMLTDAAKHGNVDVMKLLLQMQGGHIDHCNKKGDTPLIRAAWKGELEALTLLLDHGANPTICNKVGCTALIMACMHNNRACVKRLLERDTSPLNAVDDSGRSAFAYLALYAPTGGHGLAEEPYWEGMEMMLERHVRIDTPPNIGNLLLCRAANINQVHLADLLLHEGADINFCDPVNKDRPALLAHLQGAPDLACTKFLVSNHARIDYQDTDGHTGLMFAIKHNNPEITGFLLDSGASTTLENNMGETAASMCTAMIHNFQNHIAQLQQLAAADPDGIHHASAMSLHQQSLERAQLCLQLLMARSAREMGSGALLLQAAQHGELTQLEEYLTNGVPESDGQLQAIDVNFTDKAGRSALMLAAKSNHLSCVKFLLQHGALLNLRDKDGLTALTLAIRSHSKDTAELLAETIQGHSLARGFHGTGHFAAGSGAHGSSAAHDGPSAGVFGLLKSPHQQAAEEFASSTEFLGQVAEQLRNFLVHGKQAVYEALAAKQTQQQQSSSGGGTQELTIKTLPTSASSPMHLGSPLSNLPRSSSYFSSFSSFPSPSSTSTAVHRAVDPLETIEASPRHAERHVADGNGAGAESTQNVTPPAPASTTAHNNDQLRAALVAAASGGATSSSNNDAAAPAMAMPFSALSISTLAANNTQLPRSSLSFPQGSPTSTSADLAFLQSLR